MKTVSSFSAAAAVLLLAQATVAAADHSAATKQPPASLKYLWAKAYHIPPETTTEESGYFSLCEGKNGRIYIGCAAYGRDSYLVEFDPPTEKMRIVLDTHKLVGLPLEPTGYAAQSKIHTRNFAGPSGKIYVGSKQGYPTAREKETGKIATYRGGYVMTYDPATDRAVNLGMPMSLDDRRQPPGGKEGEGVIDVAADEARGLIYVITCEHQHWMLLDTRYPEKGYRDLGPILRDQPNTLIDKEGRAAAITKDYQVARYNPATGKVAVDQLLVDGKPRSRRAGGRAPRLEAGGRRPHGLPATAQRSACVSNRSWRGRRQTCPGPVTWQPHRRQAPGFAGLDQHRARQPGLLRGAHRQRDGFRHRVSPSSCSV